jgi:YfiH family protein
MGLHVGDQPEHVVANRRKLAEAVNMPFSAWTCAEQVHGNQVCQVFAGGAGKDNLEDVIAGTDGLFTDKAGILLASFYADCVPLYFLDPASRAIGLAHAGWKGTVSRIAAEMVDALGRQFGTRPQDLLVAMGPSIGGCCYEVDERILSQVQSCTGNWEAAVAPSVNERRRMLDLRRLNRMILLETGVDQKNIRSAAWCTSCRTDLFYSHRKEAGTKGTTGRMASFLGWRVKDGKVRR